MGHALVKIIRRLSHPYTVCKFLYSRIVRAYPIMFLLNAPVCFFDSAKRMQSLCAQANDS
jgi:hypothetical protein